MKYLKTSNILLLLMVIAYLCLGYLAYLLFKPFQIPTVNPDPIPITNPNKTVHYGEAITSKVTSCTYEAVPTTVSVRYQNSEGRFFQFAAADSVGKVGCRESQPNRQPIPGSLPPGSYIIYVTAVFHVTPLKDVSHVYATEWFTLEATPAGGLK